MLIKEFMTRSVITVSPEDSLKDVGKILKEKRISGVPVIDQHRNVLGVITLTDMLKILDTIYRWREIEKKNPELKFSDMFEEEKEKAKVADFMTKNVITLEEDQGIEHVMELMFTHKIHTIPIVKDGQLCGIIGKRDLICACF
ncbi:MAG: CBS domain-containing protein [Deltaproteobacteria bacterium]